jgi:hypothetical protein
LSILEKNQKGFSTIEIVLVIIMILALGLVGGLVYQRAHHNNQGGNQNCPPGTFLGYPPLPNATQEVCLRSGAVDKPVIYLYPTHSENVEVKVSYAAGFSTTVPAYSAISGWQVLAEPDGTLTSSADGKSYRYLYWEGNPAPLHFDMTKGFVVAGSRTKTFFQSQLTAMGLNQNETSAFIAYWLPKMEVNRYNLIHFAGSEYTNYAKLAITPTPSSLLRVFMVFEPLYAPVKVSSQSFPTFHRDGFSVVEWGGTQLH